MFDIYKKSPKQLYYICSAQFINRLGYFVYPFLTLYLTEKIGLSFQSTGIVVTIVSLSNIPGSLIGGSVADKIGRKKTFLIFQTLSAIFILACTINNNYLIIIINILFATFCSAAVAPCTSALISDVLSPEKRNLGFSLLYLCNNLGAAIGPIIAGFLYRNHMELLFLGDSLTSIISVILIYTKIENTITKEESIQSTKGKKYDFGFMTLLKKHNVFFFLLIYIVYSFIYIQSSFSLPITINSSFKENGPSIYSYLISINSFIVIIFTTFITTKTKNFSPIINVMIGGILYTVGFGIIGIINSFTLFIISTLIWSIGEILMVCNFSVYIVNNSPKNYIARFSALGSLSYTIGNSLGTIVIGRYMDSFEVSTVWRIIFILGIIATILTYLLYLKTKTIQVN